MDKIMEKCIKCSLEKYLHPKVVMYLSLCDHAYCENCFLEMLPHKHSQVVCHAPECPKILVRENFTSEKQEASARLINEMEIRKKVNTVYNNRPEDFTTLREYNDYLEMVEDLCQRLIENKNDEKANSEMHEYELKNEAIICRNKEIRQEERNKQIRRENKEENAKRQRREWEQKVEQKMKEHERQQKEAEIDALEKGQDFKRKKFKAPKPPKKLAIRPSSPPTKTPSLPPTSTPSSAPFYAPSRPLQPQFPVGPQPKVALQKRKLPNPKGEITNEEGKAGGFSEQAEKTRAAEEAFNSLFM